MAGVEEWSTEAQEMLSRTLELQENIQAQLMDLEACSHRNNIHIHGDNVQEFLEKYIKTQLSLPDTALGIQQRKAPTQGL